MAGSRSLTKRSHGCHSGLNDSSALVDIQVANASLSQRSSHHFIVTISPNHICAISCAITDATDCLEVVEAVFSSTNKRVSRKVTAPRFSIAPAAKSGIAIKSNLFKGYLTPK